MSDLFDKAAWGDGAWQREPDRVEFEYAGFPCLLRRNPVGCWCGYVAVPPGHRLHGVSFQDASLRVHHGVNYSEACQGEICHKPKPGEPEDVWWFGFDCGHCGRDLVPAFEPMFKKVGIEPPSIMITGVYRTLDFVREQTMRLADQLL